MSTKQPHEYIDPKDHKEHINHGMIEYTEKDLKVKVSKSKGIGSTPVITNTSKQEIERTENKSPGISGTKITSPIIGTAYLAPEPGGKKFAEKGRKIKKGDTIMIVEAMKTMNHVPCPMDGTIKEICVEDGQPVEFGQTIAILD